MDSIKAFMIGEANRGKEMMVFDWDKAAQLIKDRNAKNAAAGLSNDWEWTGGRIYENGTIVAEGQTYTYLASTWATPEIEVDGELIDCFKMESETPGWDSDTYWPESARNILED